MATTFPVNLLEIPVDQFCNPQGRRRKRVCDMEVKPPGEAPRNRERQKPGKIGPARDSPNRPKQFPRREAPHSIAEGGGYILDAFEKLRIRLIFYSFTASQRAARAARRPLSRDVGRQAAGCVWEAAGAGQSRPQVRAAR